MAGSFYERKAAREVRFPIRIRVEEWRRECDRRLWESEGRRGSGGRFESTVTGERREGEPERERERERRRVHAE